MNILEPHGTLSINLTKKSYIPGEVVKGTVKLLLEKPAKVERFLISLIGEEWVNVSCGRKDNHEFKTEEIKIHAEEIQLCDEGIYSNVEKNFEFRIPDNAPPTIWPRDPTVHTVKSKGWEIESESITHMSFSYGTETYYSDPTAWGAGLRWVVHAKLDIPWGRDKNAKEEIFIA